ncbi:cysteine desulfurase [Sporomusa acidovorans]|uniref:Cysteine desulfurase n=1 Tax=Sporomusa acidovorans (strain ATCC 49682 / DSM 3132 / Mol) TaxID=1123286 RepID=A0ABZ3IX34_SPOA4|nr:cysteine desulfurase [Sporomusa acidovorans]OZC23289.1 cysteine desulfurase [Sporomusa acidovorans DSM 3132]SDE40682.1 cysteine desulfurase / selenocysteine lyase [Sporomusa acidovorans]
MSNENRFASAGGFLKQFISHNQAEQTPAWLPDSFQTGALYLANLSTGLTDLTDGQSDNYYFLTANCSNPELPTMENWDIQSIRRDFPALQQMVNGRPLIWLDNAATTHKPQCVIAAVANFYAKDNSNVHRGAHTLAKRATDAYEGAREKIQRFIGAESAEEIIFVRGATEAINLVAQSYGRMVVRPGDEIILSNLEHHANIVPWQQLCDEKGASLKVIPLNDNGEIILEEYTKLLNSKTRLVAISHVSNSLGTVVPIKVMIDMAHVLGVPVLVDGAQGIPHFKVDVKSLDVDFYAFSGHKLFGPTGIGILYAKKTLLESMPPWQGGGNMIKTVTFEQTTYNSPPNKFEAGTGHIAGAVGLGAAVDYLTRLGPEQVEIYEQKLMAYARNALSTIPQLRQVGTSAHKAGVLSFVIPGVSSERLGEYLDHQGIAVRVGHHCSQPSLRHFGLDSTIRSSLALYNTFTEIDQLVLAVEKYLC